MTPWTKGPRELGGENKDTTISGFIRIYGGGKLLAYVAREGDAALYASATEMAEALDRIAKLTPGRANAATAEDLHFTVKAIAESALSRALGNTEGQKG